MNRITMLRTDDLNYQLPAHLIATHPTPQRAAARLMVLSRSNPNHLEHHLISDLPKLLNQGDALILNDTRVLPARLLGYRSTTKGRIEGLYLGSIAAHTWRVMLKSNARLQPGTDIILTAQNPGVDPLKLKLITKNAAVWTVEVHSTQPTETLLAQIGRPPLPPYILKARRDRHEADNWDHDDWERYQTIYAGHDAQAVAAPTAGLHFTDELLSACAQKGINRTQLTLHVGLGTFKPVETEYLQDHPMHSESFIVPPAALQLMQKTRAANTRIVAVGTTTVRTIESIANIEELDPATAIRRSTELLIAPGFKFRHSDALLTNFHLPCSTLLALVAAFLGDLPRLHTAYAAAIESKYRFYSYGDAMLILP